MNEHPIDPSEKEIPDDIIRRAIASIEEGSVPAGPPPELIAATQDVLKYPFRSREVRDICMHLSPDESRRLAAHGRKAGIVCGILMGVIMYPLMFLLMRICTPFYPPYPSFRVMFFLAIPLGLLVGWIAFGGIRRKQRRMLCETDYAKRLGFTPDTLPFYDFARNKGILILAIVVFTVVVVMFWMPFELSRPNYGDPLAGQIIDRMARVYAKCKSYRDSGVVTTLYVMKPGNGKDFTKKCPITTAFVRSDRFRFECQQDLGGKKPYRHIIWSNWKDVKPWWNVWSNRYEIQTWQDVKPGIERPNRFDYALAGIPAVGIPKLLLRSDVQFQELTQITEARLADNGQLDGVECFRVEGKYGGEQNWIRLTLWIDKKSYLVRRIDEQHKVTPSGGYAVRVVKTTTYDPIVNEEIADKLLDFDPPVRK